MGEITRREFIRKGGMVTALACSSGFAANGDAEQQHGGASSQAEGGQWIARNESTEIAVDVKSGTIQRLADRVSGEDYCHQNTIPAGWPSGLARRLKVGPRIGGLMLIDELTNKTFSDLTDPGLVNVQPQPDSNTLSLEKTYPGADFLVAETFRALPDHIRWDISIRKTRGAERNIRVVQFVPLPLRDYQVWAPIAEAPFLANPSLPFAIQYGQSTANGALGEKDWRTSIPMTVFYSAQKKRALCLTAPIEVPSVRIRFLNNTSAADDFHWNSRRYPPAQRPYFQVCHEYLSVRNKKNLETGLLISMHPSDWRPALGWVYSKYRRYFDADPSFYEWDGVYGSGRPFLADSLTPEELDKDYTEMRDAGERWEELHGHFPWYGLMIPAASVKTWTCRSHPVAGTTLSREKIEAHSKLARAHGVGTFLYYNVTESEHGYAEKQFPSSIAHSESGKPIGAWRAELYPSERACFLMNSDPTSAFGRHMIEQAKEMVSAYPDAAGFFWDVFGRSYMFDFAHDDGITMVNNKPVYYPEFMYQRLMRQHIRPLLRSKGMLITANKPVTIASCEGVDGIMASESAPEEENPPWIAAQSFLGLNRHVMIISRSMEHDPEMGFLHCLRYGMFYWYAGPYPGENRDMPARYLSTIKGLARKYGPFIQLFRGKRWIFHPHALELPQYTDGNIFRLHDGRVMITMVSAWRQLRKDNGYAEGLQVACRLPDAAKMRSVQASAIDLGERWDLTPAGRGDTLRFTVPRHGKATAIVLAQRD